MNDVLKKVNATEKIKGSIVWRKAAEEIIKFTEFGNFDLIVMATHGRVGLKRFLLGSVAEQVNRHAPCPVLALRIKGK